MAGEVAGGPVQAVLSHVQQPPTPPQDLCAKVLHACHVAAECADCTWVLQSLRQIYSTIWSLRAAFQVTWATQLAMQPTQWEQQMSGLLTSSK